MLIEILVFAVIAWIILYRLFSILGDVDITVLSSNARGIKDVTNTQPVDDRGLSPSQEHQYKIDSIRKRVGTFDEYNFVQSVVKLAILVMDISKKGTWSEVEYLVDSRFFKEIQQYKYLKDIKNLNAKIKDVIFFGKNIMIKVELIGDSFSEIWSFNRHLARKSQIWHLSNIKQS